MPHVLGIDLGTTSLKGLVVDKQGQLVAQAQVSYETQHPQLGYSEQNPAVWTDAMEEVMEQLIRSFPNLASSLEAISFSGQMHSLVMLDHKGQVLHPAILWNDGRTHEECQILEHTLGERLIDISKNVALPGFTLPKLLWVKRNLPEIWAQIGYFLLPKDYLRYWLGAPMQMDYSDASGTLLLDMKQGKWSEELCQSLDIPLEWCPPLVESMSVVGWLRPELAHQWGLIKPVKLVAGGADNACGALGAGLIPEQGLVSIGTSGVYLQLAALPDDTSGRTHVFQHVVPGQYYQMGVTLAAGDSLKWYKSQFLPDLSYEQLFEAIAEQDAKELVPLWFTPYLQGERCPYPDSKVRASFMHLDISHGPLDLARSIVEGITFSLRDLIQLVEKETKVTPTLLRSIGGGSQSSYWCQLQANIFTKPVVTILPEQGPGLGAAMLAAMAMGWFESFPSCQEQFLKLNQQFNPEKDKIQHYQDLYEVYKQIYPRTRNLTD